MVLKALNSIAAAASLLYLCLILLCLTQTVSGNTISCNDLEAIPDLFTEHYHFKEVHGNTTYLIRRVGGGISDKGGTDELWEYHDQTCEKIYSAKGLDFRIFPAAGIGVITYGEDNAGKNLIFIQLASKKIIKRFVVTDFLTDEPEEVTQVALSLLSSLSRDNTYFWGCVANTYYPENTIFRINTKNWHIDKFNIKGLGIGEYFQLNPEIATIVYTDMPTFFDVDSYQEWMKGSPVITTYTYNLFTKEKKTIDRKAMSPEVNLEYPQ